MASVIVNSKYSPFSFEEVLKPVEYLSGLASKEKEKKEQIVDTLDTTTINLTNLESYIPDDSELKAEYNNLYSDLGNLADQMASGNIQSEQAKRNAVELYKRASALTSQVKQATDAYSKYRTLYDSYSNNPYMVMLGDVLSFDAFTDPTASTIPKYLDLTSEVNKAKIYGKQLGESQTPTVSTISQPDGSKLVVTERGLAPNSISSNQDIINHVNNTISTLETNMNTTFSSEERAKIADILYGGYQEGAALGYNQDVSLNTPEDPDSSTYLDKVYKIYENANLVDPKYVGNKFLLSPKEEGEYPNPDNYTFYGYNNITLGELKEWSRKGKKNNNVHYTFDENAVSRLKEDIKEIFGDDSDLDSLPIIVYYGKKKEGGKTGLFIEIPKYYYKTLADNDIEAGIEGERQAARNEREEYSKTLVEQLLP